MFDEGAVFAQIETKRGIQLECAPTHFVETGTVLSSACRWCPRASSKVWDRQHAERTKSDCLDTTDQWHASQRASPQFWIAPSRFSAARCASPTPKGVGHDPV